MSEREVAKGVGPEQGQLKATLGLAVNDREILLGLAFWSQSCIEREAENRAAEIQMTGHAPAGLRR